MRTHSRQRDESGAIAVLVAVTSIVLFVIAALVVDLGLARDTRRQSQNAADASALAAANVLYPAGTCQQPAGGTPPCIADAVAAAKDYARANFGVATGDWAGCPVAPSGFHVSPGTPTCISFDNLAHPTRVWVLMPTRDVKTGLGNLAGVSSVPVTSAARAVVTPGGLASCGLCLLGGGTHYIQNGDIAVSGTSVQTNGNLGTQQNNGHVTVTGGSVQVEGTATGNISPTAQTGAGTLVDPLAGIELPGPSNAWFAAPTGLKTNICSQGPGFYRSPTVANNCVLQPGLYVITGTLQLAGQKSIDARAGVTLYFTCGASPTPPGHALHPRTVDRTHQGPVDRLRPAQHRGHRAQGQRRGLGDRHHLRRERDSRLPRQRRGREHGRARRRERRRLPREPVDDVAHLRDHLERRAAPERPCTRPIGPRHGLRSRPAVAGSQTHPRARSTSSRRDTARSSQGSRLRPSAARSRTCSAPRR